MHFVITLLRGCCFVFLRVFFIFYKLCNFIICALYIFFGVLSVQVRVLSHSSILARSCIHLDLSGIVTTLFPSGLSRVCCGPASPPAGLSDEREDVLPASPHKGIREEREREAFTAAG